MSRGSYKKNEIRGYPQLRVINPERNNDIIVTPNWENATWTFVDAPYGNFRLCTFIVKIAGLEQKRRFKVEKGLPKPIVEAIIREEKTKTERDVLEALANKHGSLYPTQKADSCSPCVPNRWV